MRRITLSYLALPCILLGLSCPAAAQIVSIQLTPITYPIVLPDSGGSFDYLLFVTNQGSTPLTATVWCMVTLPNGSPWGPVLGPATQTLGAGQTVGYFRSWTVPPRAPFGYYIFHACVGIYPNTVWAQDQFEFQHQAISGTEQEWVARYNGPGNGQDEAYALAIDAEGNIYVTGYSQGSGTTDYATVKYEAAGVQLWEARYDGGEEDYARSLAIDANGNVYVTGESEGMGTSWDYATIKYNSAGTQQWVARYNGPGNSYDGAFSLDVDSAGNVYVTGQSNENGFGSADYATIKYDAMGNQIWVARYNGPANGSDEALSLVLDDDGHIYVTGRSDGAGGPSYNYDYATLSYDSEGRQLWVARYVGLGGTDWPSSLSVDGNANVYVTGKSQASETGYDYATVKYDPAGGQLWVARYNGPGGYYNEDGALSLDVDDGENVYVTGYSHGNGTDEDYATIKYDANGNQIWVARYNSPEDHADCANSLEVDTGGNTYVTGVSYARQSYFDCVTIKYDGTGMQRWIARYNGPGNGPDRAYFLALDGNGNAFVTGHSQGLLGGGLNLDYATIKYSGGNLDNWLPVEATLLGQPLPQEFALHQNYPNPFNATTVLSYQLPVASHISLRIYDTAGRLVETLVDGWRSAGVHELTFEAGDLPSGMYVYRIQAGNWTESGKMILLK